MNKKDPNQEVVGNGGELHQQADRDVLTTNFGIPVSDNQNSLKAGEKGPVLLEDFVLRDKIFHFDHERIPERIVHARGSGAHGFFECTESLADLTTASLFQNVGEKTELFIRFSTVAGGAGSVDTPRDVRGFAVKFYTKQGNWDLVGNNIPVFFVQDAMKFPDLIHSVKMEADRGYPQAASAHDTFWDFISLMPETTHTLMWAMSDRAIPRSLRMMEGFGVHTFRLVNKEGKSTFVKFHWKPKLGMQSTLWDEAVKIAGADPDFHRRDLYEAIEAGDFPEWELGVQLFDDKLADSLPYDVLDATKMIPEEIVPVRIVGRMVLNRNPDNFFAETEQAAFLPSNIVPGIEFTNDPLLQGRLFSYLDTQKSRLGTTNFNQIPINAPKGCPFHNFYRDGMMQTEVPKGRANYEPNSLSQAGEPGGPRESAAGFTSFPQASSGDKRRIRAETFKDHYSQPRMFYLSQQAPEQLHIAKALIFELSKVTLDHVRERFLGNLIHVDKNLAQQVADGLGVSLPNANPAAAAVVELAPSKKLSIIGNAKPTLEGRKIAIVIADGSGSEMLQELKQAIKLAKATPFVVAPRLKGIKLNDGSVVDADGQLAGSPSVLFDAVSVILSPDAITKLKNVPALKQFLADAFHHLKAIGLCEASRNSLYPELNLPVDEGVVTLDKLVEAAKKRYYAREGKE